MTPTRIRATLLFSALLILFTSGCAGYRLGSMLPADIRTVYVPTCINKTTEPLIENNVTRAIMAEIQMNGSLKLVSDESAADTVLEVTLINFWLDPVAYAKNSSATTREYRMNIRASFHLLRRADNTVLVESPGLTGWKDFEMTGDMTTSKSVALRPAAEDLGRRIVDQIVEAW